MLLLDNDFLNLKYRYLLVIKPKTNKYYKNDFFIYLSTSAFNFFSFYFLTSISILLII